MFAQYENTHPTELTTASKRAHRIVNVMSGTVLDLSMTDKVSGTPSQAFLHCIRFVIFELSYRVAH